MDFEIMEIDVTPSTRVLRPRGRPRLNPPPKLTNIADRLDTGSLDMECECVDDPFADDIDITCEDDILTEQQWNNAIDEKREYEKFAAVINEAKLHNGTVKFIPEAEATMDVGKTTATISETIKVINIKPVESNAYNRRKQNLPVIDRHSIPLLFNKSPQIQTPQTPLPSTSVQTSPLNLYVPVLPNGVISPGLLLNKNNQSLPIGTRLVMSQGQGPLILYPRGVFTNSNIMSPTNVTQLNTSPIALNFQNPNVRNPLTFVTQHQSVPRQRMANYSQTSPLIRIHSPSPVIRNTLRGQRPQTPVSSIPTIDLKSPMSSQRSMATRSTRNTNQLPPQNVNLIQSAVAKGNSPSYYDVVSDVPSNAPIQKYDCLAVIKGGTGKKHLTTKTLLTIKPLPFSWPSTIDALIQSLVKLDNALMKEKFKESPIAWMVNAKLIFPPKCKSCGPGICNYVQRHFEGQEYWKCNEKKCQKLEAIQHPSVFDTIPCKSIPVSKLLFVIYYWSIQVDVEDLIKTGQIDIPIDTIFSIWRKLQEICAVTLKKENLKLGATRGVTKLIEVATVQVGKFYIIGAMEVATRRCKIGVMPHNMSDEPFLDFIRNSIIVGSDIKTCESKFMALTKWGYHVNCVNKSEFLNDVGAMKLNNIGGYLIQHMQRLFKDINLSTVNHLTLSHIMNELQWRERFGSDPFTAFTNIIKHIAGHCKENETGITKIVATNTVSNTLPRHINQSISYSIASKQNNSSHTRQTPSSTTAAIVADPTGPDVVYVDEYYYSSLQLKSAFAKSHDPQEISRASIQCHLCQMYYDNILIVRHLLEHLEKERRGRVRKDDHNQSECKHCLRFFSLKSMPLHEDLVNQKLIKFSCRFCAMPFFNRINFITHMRQTHFANEMPYHCDMCSYRSSFQKNLYNHFEVEHAGVESILCPYCIRIFPVAKFKNLSQFVYRHLTNHYALASVYDCDKCMLTFTRKEDLRGHCFKGHNSLPKIDEKFDIVPYKLSQDEVQFVVRASVNELFTPNLPMVEFSNDDTTDLPQETFELTPDVFMSVEPEVQISLTDGGTFGNFVVPVESDYTDEQFKNMVNLSFKFSKSIVANKNVAINNGAAVNCIECNNHLTNDHYIKMGICGHCNYKTHCKSAFSEHMKHMHSDAPSSMKYASQFATVATRENNAIIKCSKCKYQTNVGNEMALHLVNTNHSVSTFKSL